MYYQWLTIFYSQNSSGHYPKSVCLVGVTVRDQGEAKKLDSADAPLRTGDQVSIEVEGDVTYGIVYTEPSSTLFIPPIQAEEIHPTQA